MMARVQITSRLGVWLRIRSKRKQVLFFYTWFLSYRNGPDMLERKFNRIPLKEKPETVKQPTELEALCQTGDIPYLSN